MNTLIKKILFICLLALASTSYVVAERYNAIKINNNLSIVGINNRATITGLDQTTTLARPYIWRLNRTNKTYDETEIEYLPINFTYTEIHVTAIANEDNSGAGGYVIGWYLDEFNKAQAVLWYNFETTEKVFEYRITLLKPLEELAKYCRTGKLDDIYFNPECMRGGIDDVRIQAAAKDCAVINERWQFTDRFKLSPCSETSASIPICTYAMTRTKSESQAQQNDNSTRINYDFDFNPLYESDAKENITVACMRREHAQLSILASKCAENDDWSYDINNPPETIEPTVITCDKSNKAYSINNQNTIIGVSYDVNDNPHPVAWIVTGTDPLGVPIFKTINLGIDRVDVTSQTIVTENENRNDDDPEKSKSYDIQRRFGEALLASAATPDAAGFIQKKLSDSQYTAFYWRKVDSAGAGVVSEIRKPEKDSKGEFIPFAQTDIRPNLTVVSSGLVGGWYKTNENVIKATEWRIRPARDSDNQVLEVLIPEPKSMLEPNAEGKILHGNSIFESVGTTKVTNKDGLVLDHAFYSSFDCDIQDLNNLLIAPIADSTSVLSEANKIGTGSFNPISAIGIDPESAAFNKYILVPKIIYVNLKIEIVADQSRLTVGEEHSYYVTLSNNGKPNDELEANFATCVEFTFDASVFTEEFDDNGLRKEELLAGLSFLRVESDPDLGLNCKFSVVQLTCTLIKLSLDAGPVTIRVVTKPRPLLADRRIRVKVHLTSTERELINTQDDNSSSLIINVDRKGCFIATAAYGSYLAPEVAALRRFRDDILLLTAPGRWLVETYYDISPEYADIIDQDEQLRTISRWILSPLVYLILYPIPILSGLLLIIAITYRIKKRNQF